MTSLADKLAHQQETIERHLFIGSPDWADLLARLERHEQQPARPLADEQLWTFLFACAYAAAGEAGVAALSKALTCATPPQPAAPRVWMEVRPLPPRIKEGGTRLDLALGTIARRGTTKSGIELAGDAPSWICFCECKWHADISSNVTHDPHRNQLLRVIENALCFQQSGRCADSVYVTLITPKAYRDAPPENHQYHQLFARYQTDPSSLVQDLKKSPLCRRNQRNWIYPKLEERLNHLTLRWVTYQQLLEDLPPSPISAALRQFALSEGFRPRRDGSTDKTHIGPVHQ